MLRGGSWNNNQDNARAHNRNNNHPNNRNNNIGFRVVCGATSTFALQLPACPAGHGSRDAAESRWMARVRPVRTLPPGSVGRIQKERRRLGFHPAAPLLASNLPDPPAQKPPKLHHHAAHVFVLAV